MALKFVVVDLAQLGTVYDTDEEAQAHAQDRGNPHAVVVLEVPDPPVPQDVAPAVVAAGEPVKGAIASTVQDTRPDKLDLLAAKFDGLAGAVTDLVAHLAKDAAIVAEG